MRVVLETSRGSAHCLRIGLILKEGIGTFIHELQSLGRGSGAAVAVAAKGQ